MWKSCAGACRGFCYDVILTRGLVHVVSKIRREEHLWQHRRGRFSLSVSTRHAIARMRCRYNLFPRLTSEAPQG